jgi:hypothetical protein
MDEPLDDAEFLIRSANRVRVLELLVEGSRAPRHMQDDVEVTRVTMGRLPGDLSPDEAAYDTVTNLTAMLE